MRGIALAVVAVMLASCASRPSGRQIVAEAKAALDASVTCCKDLSTAARLPLPSKPATVRIDARSPVYDFGGNKAYFVLYELPPYERPYWIDVSSRSAGTQDDVALFIPRIAMYDAGFKVTRFFDEKTLRNRGNDLERTVFVNPADRDERYMAVYGSDLSASIERAYSMVTVQTVPVGLGFVMLYGGKDGKSVLRSSPVGELEIEAHGLDPAAR